MYGRWDFAGMVESAAETGDLAHLERYLRELKRSAEQRPPQLWRFSELPGHRFYGGHATYVGTPSYETAAGELVVGPGSVALPADTHGASFEEENIQTAWEHWTPDEQAVYVEAREMALGVIEGWRADRGETAGDDWKRGRETRLAVARFATSRVIAFRGWWFGVERTVREREQARAPRKQQTAPSSRTPARASRA